MRLPVSVQIVQLWSGSWFAKHKNFEIPCIKKRLVLIVGLDRYLNHASIVCVSLSIKSSIDTLSCISKAESSRIKTIHFTKKYPNTQK